MVLFPVFAGRDESGELYVLYRKMPDDRVDWKPFGKVQEVQPPEEFHLMLPDRKIHALAPGSNIQWWQTNDSGTHMKIQSGVWTGELKGTKKDLMEAKIMDRSDWSGY